MSEATYQIVGAFRPEFAVTGFLPPVLKNTATGGLASPITESGRIVGFETQSADLALLSAPKEDLFTIGDATVFAYLNPDGRLETGTLEQLTDSLLQKLTQRQKQNVYDRLEIASLLELWGVVTMIFQQEIPTVRAQADPFLDISVRNDYIDWTTARSQPCSEAGFLEITGALMKKFRRPPTDLIALYDKYALIGPAYIEATGQLIRSWERTDAIFINNIPYLDAEWVISLLDNDEILSRHIYKRCDALVGTSKMPNVPGPVLSYLAKRFPKAAPEPDDARPEDPKPATAAKTEKIKQRLMNMRDSILQKHTQSSKSVS